MGKALDLTGQEFGYLTALKKIGSNRYGGIWECKCKCGNLTEVLAVKLRNGTTKSCGCKQREPKETLRKKYPTEYNSWLKMKERCYLKTCPKYNSYGAVGVTVCDEWKNSFQNFIKDMGGKPNKKCTIDRIDNEKGYEPSNCRWASTTTQARNRRKHKNKELPRGIYRNKRTGKYQVKITVNYKEIYMGEFESLEEAKKIRKQAENKYWEEPL